MMIESGLQYNCMKSISYISFFHELFLYISENQEIQLLLFNEEMIILMKKSNYLMIESG